MTTKTYTDRSNARRAAKAAGLDLDTLTFVQVDGRWTWDAKEEPKVVDAPAEHIPAEKPAQDEPALMEIMDDAAAILDGVAAREERTEARAARRQRLISAAQAVAQPRVATRHEAGPRGKMALINDMLNRSEGCTREEILAATGWPSVSVQQCAKSLRLELVVDKTSRPFRYRAAQTQALAA